MGVKWQLKPEEKSANNAGKSQRPNQLLLDDGCKLFTALDNLKKVRLLVLSRLYIHDLLAKTNTEFMPDENRNQSEY